MAPTPPPEPPPAVTVVGIGADGWPGLTDAARRALRDADVVIGAARQLGLLPAQCTAERVAWPTPLRPAVPRLLAAHAGRRTAVLASGDPLFHGIGRAVVEELAATGARWRMLPHPSSVSYACARLGWPVEDVEVITLVGRPTARLAAALHHGRRLLVLGSGAAAPAEVAALLRDRGFGPSPLRVLEQLGGERERVVGGRERTADGRGLTVDGPERLVDGRERTADGRELTVDGRGRIADAREAGGREGTVDGRERTAGEPGAGDGVATADTWSYPPGDPLNIVAVECRRAPGAPRLGAVPGLPDDAYESDGQLTKRHLRAVTLGVLAPEPGELLWDIGGGSGSIGIEWMRVDPRCGAVTVERDPQRAARIVRNAERLGAPGLRVVTGTAPDALDGLPVPDAVFIGGGLTTPGLLDACLDALPGGGRLVANTVTLESEALLAAAHRRHGGDLVRLAVAHAVPVGAFTGWRQAMPVTQWAVTKAGGGRGAGARPGAPEGGGGREGQRG